MLSSGACIGMPPAVGCPVTHLNDIGASSGAALAVRLGAEGIEALSRPITMRNRDGRHRVVVDAATAHVTVTARSGLIQGGERNSSAHQALPNRAHGALPLHHQIRGR